MLWHELIRSVPQQRPRRPYATSPQQLTLDDLADEFVVAGLLPQIAGDVKVSVARAGLLITVSAVGMTVGAPLTAMLTLRPPARSTLIIALGIFAGGHVIVALDAGTPLAARYSQATPRRPEALPRTLEPLRTHILSARKPAESSPSSRKASPRERASHPTRPAQSVR